MKCKRILSVLLAGILLCEPIGSTITAYAAPTDVDGSQTAEAPVEPAVDEAAKATADAISGHLTKEDYASVTTVMMTAEHPMKVLELLDQDSRYNMYAGMSDDIRFQLKNRIMYDFTELLTEMENTGAEKQKVDTMLDLFNEFLGNLPSESDMLDNMITDEDIEQMKVDADQAVLDAMNNIHQSKDGKQFQSLAEYMDYLQQDTSLDVTEIINQLKGLWYSPSDQVEAKTKEVRAYLYSVYGFDDESEKPEPEEPVKEETEKPEEEKSEGKTDHIHITGFADYDMEAGEPLDTVEAYEGLKDEAKAEFPKTLSMYVEGKKDPVGVPVNWVPYMTNEKQEVGLFTYQAEPANGYTYGPEILETVFHMKGSIPFIELNVKRVEELKPQVFHTNPSSLKAWVTYEGNFQTWGKRYGENDGVIGTEGEAKRMESIRITLQNAGDTGIRYRGYVEGQGWTGWYYNGGICGTEGQAKRLEIIEIGLYGPNASDYQLQVHTQAQTVGWQAKTVTGPNNTITFGSTGKRIEAFAASVLPVYSGKTGYHRTNCSGCISYQCTAPVIAWKGGGTTGTGGAEDLKKITCPETGNQYGPNWCGVCEASGIYARMYYDTIWEHHWRCIHGEHSGGWIRTYYSVDAHCTRNGGTAHAQGGDPNLLTVYNNFKRCPGHNTANTYTVYYNGNGATGGSTAASGHTYDTAKNLTANGFTRTGYTFKGWNTRADGTGTSYSNSQSVKNLTATNGGSVTLYAQWSPVTHTNYIDHWMWGFRNGEGNNGDKSAFKIAQTSFRVVQGYSFTMDAERKTTIPNGFYIEQDFGTDSISGSWSNYAFGTRVAQKNGSMYFEYDYYPNNYAIKYNLDGGKNHASNPSTYNVLYGVTLQNPTKAGYEFLGWEEELFRAEDALIYNGASRDGETFTFTNSTSGNTFNASKVQVWTNDGGTYIAQPVSGATGNNISGKYTHNESTGNYMIRVSANGTTQDYSAPVYNVFLEKGKTYTFTIGSSSVTSNKVVVGDVSVKGTVTGINAGKNASFASSSQMYSELANRKVGNVELTAKWKALNYTVKYNGNGATGGSTGDSTHAIGIAKALNANGFTRTGYTFKNWNTKADGSGTAYSNQQSVTNLAAAGSSITLYAQWTANAYTVKYNGNGSTGGSTASSSHTFNVAKALTANGFTRTGYTFKGWNTQADGKGTAYTNGQSVKNLTATNGGTVNLYAQWTPNTYTVKYNGNGATGGSTASSSHTYDTAKALTANGFTRTGYTFKGWNTQADGKGTAYTNGQSVKNLTATNGGTVNLYAQWTANAYTVKYNGNGATGGSTASSTHTYDVAKALTANGFSRTGYTFKGWNTQADGKGTAYTNGQSVKNLTATNGGTVNLYAQWTANAYTVQYNGNGATGGSTASSTHTYDVAKALTANGFTRTGYTFKGWNTQADGKGTAYTNQQSVKNLTATNGATVNLYAQWTPNTYTVKYNGNGATGGSTASSSHTYDTAKALTANGFTRTGYTFKGWNTQASGKGTAYTNGQSVKNLTATNGGTVTLYAQWTSNAYTVKYDGNGATSGSTASSSHTYDVAKALTANGFVRAGYTFKGWNTKADGSGTSYANQQSVKNLTATNGATVTLYAQWTGNTLTINYHLNGGTDIASDPNFTSGDPAQVSKISYPNTTGVNGLINVSTDRVTPPTGYLIKNVWNTKADGSGKDFNFTTEYKLTDLNAAIMNGNCTIDLYAQYTPKTLVTTFHRNTSSSDAVTAQQTFTYDVAGQKFTDKKWSRTGYTLLGWADSKTATKQQYAILSGVSNAWIDSHAPKNDIYAVWKANQYTIVFDGNGATGGSTPSLNVKYDQTWKIPENGFRKGPFEFVEWNTKPDGSGTTYVPGTDVKNLTSKDGDKITLYAIWEEQVKVVYEGNGATAGTQKTDMVSAEDLDVQYNYTVKKNKAYTDYSRTGHEFDGWWWKPVNDYLGNHDKYYQDENVNKVRWETLMGNAGASVSMPFSSVGFSMLADVKAEKEVKSVSMHAQWDKEPELTVDNGKNTRTFFEGVDITEKDLLKGVSVKDYEDDLTGTALDIKVVKIEYAAGKLVDGKKQPAYTKTFKNGMTDADKLDTWFLQMEKNAEVTHKVTYEVTDSGGNTVQATGNVYVKYNNFPAIESEDRYFTLEEAQAGKITQQELLDKQLANKTIKVKDTEEGDFVTPGNGAKKVNLVDFDAAEFKNFTESGYRTITIHTQDSYGPGGKGKETTKQIVVYVVKDGEIPDVNKAKAVRFIDEENYNKNKDVDPETMTEAEIEQRNANGGLNVNSKWYHDEEYRNEIEGTFDKTSGDSYHFTEEEVEQIKAYVDDHGVGNMQEDNALSDFADRFLNK